MRAGHYDTGIGFSDRCKLRYLQALRHLNPRAPHGFEAYAILRQAEGRVRRLRAPFVTYAPNNTDDTMLVGFKGAQFMETGFILGGMLPP